MKFLFSILIFLPNTFGLYSQDTFILEGIIISEELECLSGIIIYDTDTIALAFSDEGGHFKIENLTMPKELLLFGMGVEWTRVSIREDCNNVEIIMLLLYNYDFMSLRRMNKDRFRRYNNRENICNEAIEAGIFASCDNCLSYSFEKW